MKASSFVNSKDKTKYVHREKKRVLLFCEKIKPICVIQYKKWPSNKKSIEKQDHNTMIQTANNQSFEPDQTLKLFPGKKQGNLY